jgi:hypothetical protein
MHTFTTTIRVQPTGRGLEIHTFNSEAKDIETAKERALEKLCAQYEDTDLSILSCTTSSLKTVGYDRRAMESKPKRTRH